MLILRNHREQQIEILKVQASIYFIFKYISNSLDWRNKLKKEIRNIHPVKKRKQTMNSCARAKLGDKNKESVGQHQSKQKNHNLVYSTINK